eukprot:5377397-Prymnesium_polylepis.2
MRLSARALTRLNKRPHHSQTARTQVHGSRAAWLSEDAVATDAPRLDDNSSWSRWTSVSGPTLAYVERTSVNDPTPLPNI